MRSLALILALFVVTTGTAVAGRGDPQKRITPADQVRAKAMLLRKGDVGLGYRATPRSGGDDDLYCRALDESDLTQTGDAQSADFSLGTTVVSSLAQVYESLADANASWRRGTSAAGEKCVRDTLRSELMRQGIRNVSFRRVAFPSFAQRSVAYRLTGLVQGLPVFFDIHILQQARAHAAILTLSALEPVPRSEQVRLARLVAARMAKAMRGG